MEQSYGTTLRGEYGSQTDALHVRWNYMHDLNNAGFTGGANLRDPMNVLEMISKPGALVSGWTSAILCFSAASGFWLARERGRAICWAVIGAVEVVAIIW
jgi:hypothetical protein